MLHKSLEKKNRGTRQWQWQAHVIAGKNLAKAQNLNVAWYWKRQC